MRAKFVVMMLMMLMMMMVMMMMMMMFMMMVMVVVMIMLMMLMMMMMMLMVFMGVGMGSGLSMYVGSKLLVSFLLAQEMLGWSQHVGQRSRSPRRRPPIRQGLPPRWTSRPHDRENAERCWLFCTMLRGTPVAWSRTTCVSRRWFRAKLKAIILPGAMFSWAQTTDAIMFQHQPGAKPSGLVDWWQGVARNTLWP